MLRKLCLVLSLLLVASPVSAQLNLSYTSFQPGQTISSAQFTANFTSISNNALNRNGGEMEGDLEFGTNNTYDIGKASFRPRDLFVGRNVDIDGTLDVAGAANFAGITVTGLTCTGCVGATQLASSGVSAASYGSASTVATFTVDEDGRITTAGSSSIQITESQITDGSVLARVAGNETISGTWTFTAAALNLTNDTAQFIIRESDAGTNGKVWRFLANGGVFNFTLLDDANGSSGTFWRANRTGTTPVSLETITVLPIADSTYNLGSSSVRWATVYADTLVLTDAFSPSTVQTTSTSTTAPHYSGDLDPDSGISVINTASAGEVGIWVDGSKLAYVRPTASVINTPLAVGGDLIGLSTTYAIGGSSQRWNIIYLVNAPNVSSDIRLKENIIDLPYGLESLKRIGVYQYNLKADPTRTHYGVMAQQLKEIGLDHIVSGSEEEGYGVAYDELIPVLIKSIQELEARVAELEAR